MANAEHLEILKEGVEVWNEWRGKSPDLRPILTGSDLSSMNLSGADLNNADLGGAKLNNSNLIGIDLSSSNLGGANLYRIENYYSYFPFNY